MSRVSTHEATSGNFQESTTKNNSWRGYSNNKTSFDCSCMRMNLLPEISRLDSHNFVVSDEQALGENPPRVLLGLQIGFKLQIVPFYRQPRFQL